MTTPRHCSMSPMAETAHCSDKVAYGYLVINMILGVALRTGWGVKSLSVPWSRSGLLAAPDGQHRGIGGTRTEKTQVRALIILS